MPFEEQIAVRPMTMITLDNQIYEDITYAIIYSAMINTLQNISSISAGRTVGASGTETVYSCSIPGRIKLATTTASIHDFSTVI